MALPRDSCTTILAGCSRGYKSVAAERTRFLVNRPRRHDLRRRIDMRWSAFFTIRYFESLEVRRAWSLISNSSRSMLSTRKSPLAEPQSPLGVR